MNPDNRFFNFSILLILLSFSMFLRLTRLIYIGKPRILKENGHGRSLQMMAQTLIFQELPFRIVDFPM